MSPRESPPGPRRCAGMWALLALPLTTLLDIAPPPPALDYQFFSLDGWHQKAPHGSVQVARASEASDGWATALTFPGNPDADPRDRVGPVKWPVELRSIQSVHFGSYRARMRFASCSASEELVSAFFVYARPGEDRNENGISDNPEIDIELLCGEPHLLWLTVWTDYERRDGQVQCRKQTRVVDMRTGTVRASPRSSLCSSQLLPAARLAGVRVADFPGTRFWELGFDWYPDRITYFIVLDGREVPLWTLTDRVRIPQRPVQLRLQLWHSAGHWNRRGLANYPARDGVLQVDWARYWAAR